MTVLHVVLPGDIDDPRHPTGGNVYDREVCRGLTDIGWTVHEHPVSGGWPHPQPDDRARLATVLAGLPGGALVLVDGLVASAAPTEIAAAAARLRLVVLVHMLVEEDPSAHSPPSHAAERAGLAAAVAVVATSRATRERIRELYGPTGAPVHVVEPGVRPTDPVVATRSGARLVSVGAITHAKGHDVLIEALGMVTDLSWLCVCVGPLDRQPGFARSQRRRAEELDIGDRTAYPGPLAGAALAAAYARADLLVHPSRTEPYGMVVTESLARGIPVVASDVGGVPEALGRAAGGDRPGVLVPPGDADALAGALRRWLEDDGCRDRLRAAARERRPALVSWQQASARMAHVLSEVADEPRPALTGA